MILYAWYFLFADEEVSWQSGLGHMGKLSQALAPAGRPPNNADIVLRLAQSIHQLPISTIIAWVRSHQDRNPRITWTKGAKLNILANELADAYLSNNPQGTLGHPESNSSHFPTMQASLLLGTTRIHSATSSWMPISIQNYREFFIQKHRIRFHQTISTILIGRSFLRHSGSRKERELWMSTLQGIRDHGECAHLQMAKNLIQSRSPLIAACLSTQTKNACRASQYSHFCCLHHSSFAYTNGRVSRTVFPAQIHQKKLLSRRQISSNARLAVFSPWGVMYLLDWGLL